MDYEMNKYIPDNIGLLLVVISAVQLNLWCAVCVFSGVFLTLTLSALANTSRKTPFQKDKDIVFHPLLRHPTGKT